MRKLKNKHIYKRKINNTFIIGNKLFNVKPNSADYIKLPLEEKNVFNFLVKKQ